MWMLALLGVLILVLAVLYVFFGPGIDEDNFRASLPHSRNERDFLEAYVRHGQEESGFLRRPRPRNQVLKLFYRLWVPKQLDAVSDAKGVVVVIHGLNSHSARNNQLVREVLESGFVVAGFDHEGLGRSGGRHGYFSSVSHLVDDAIAVVEMVRDKYQGRKVFLHGGSLGGLLVLNILIKMQKETVDGAIIQCPALSVHSSSRPHFLIELLGRMLAAVAPKLPITAGHRNRGSSPEVAAIVDAIKRQDPLFYNGKLRIGTGLAMLEAMEEIQEKLHLVEAPYLLQHGEADQVCSLEGSQVLHEQTGSDDKTFITYPNCAHDMAEEPKEVKDKVVNDFVAWLLARC